MNRLKRRQSNKGGTPAPSAKRQSINRGALNARISHYQEVLWSRWQALSPRDQLALSLLTVFLLVFIGGFGGYSLHMAAKDSKAAYQEEVAVYFWLRSQAGNIDGNANVAMDQTGDTALPPASQINGVLNNSGINDAQVVATGESIQISFSHDSQAVVSSALANLEQQGWQLTTLTMQQDTTTKRIEVQAAVI